MSTETPSVTVIVLNYNGLEHLGPCFRSLTDLDYPAEQLELMLVDNGSTDGSVDWMRAHFPTVQVVETGRNLGFAGGNNAGVRAAHGEFVTLLNNDMRVAPDWLSEILRPFGRDSDIAAVAAKVLSWDGKRIDFAHAAMNFYGYSYQVGHGDPDDGQYDQERALLFANGASVAFRREVFLSVGGFDADYFAYYEDVDLGWRLWLLGYKVWFAPRAVCYHRHHGTSRRLADEKIRLLYERNALYTLIKNYDHENLQRVLPVALMLSLERSYLLAGLDSSAFRLEGESGPPQAEPPGEPRYTTGYYLRQAWQSLRKGGPRGLYHKIKGELHWRSSHPAFASLLRRRRARASGGSIAVPAQALSGLVAADDLIRHYPRLLEKRARIQAARRRTDKEIFELFGLPLELSYFDAEYQSVQRVLERCFQIEIMFKAEGGER